MQVFLLDHLCIFLSCCPFFYFRSFKISIIACSIVCLAIKDGIIKFRTNVSMFKNFNTSLRISLILLCILFKFSNSFQTKICIFLNN